MSVHKGACLCGDVTYKLNSRILKVVNCHCNFCRSHTGSAFSTYAAALYKSLEITSGQEKLTSHQANEGKKHFCSSCGTPIFNINVKHPGICMVYFGTLKDSREITPATNVWCESKLTWVDNISSIHSMDKGVEQRKKG